MSCAAHLWRVREVPSVRREIRRRQPRTALVGTWNALMRGFSVSLWPCGSDDQMENERHQNQYHQKEKFRFRCHKNVPQPNPLLIDDKLFLRKAYARDQRPDWKFAIYDCM